MSAFSHTVIPNSETKFPPTSHQFAVYKWNKLAYLTDDIRDAASFLNLDTCIAKRYIMSYDHFRNIYRKVSPVKKPHFIVEQLL
ncbi:hypothetical protein JCM19233_3558 [Vibrio astriarenae]|nr:hypothetical protein JCM19233_3558 [Vibrio sp. C7]